MELYILDSNLRRSEMIESYQSLIWTERFQGYGDFQIDIDPNLPERSLTTQGTFLGINKSDRVMYVDSVETKSQEDGTKLLVIKGKSLEAKMLERPNAYTANLASPVILGNGTTTKPADIVRNLFSSICVSNVEMAIDQMPFIQAGVYSPTTGRIAESVLTPQIQTTVGTLYDTIKSICEVYDLGFRLIRPLDDSKLYFEVYTGYDRTTSQTARDAVVFSSQLDNLVGTTELTTSDAYRNIAYVFGLQDARLVTADGSDGSGFTGFNRKILIVDANDITEASGPVLWAKLDQRGREELAIATNQQVFDGAISQNGSYNYGTHYMLGDLVEKRSETGSVNQMRVTEQILVSDSEGEKSYPTLTLKAFIVPGSWDAVSPARNWDSYTTETWDSQ